MEEKTVVKSEPYNVKLFRNVLLIVAAALIAYVCIYYLLNIGGCRIYTFHDGDTMNIDFFNYLANCSGGSGIVFILGILSAIIAVVVNLIYSKIELTVTDKRVYGKATFGKRVDLPLDSINAVGTSAFNGVSVTTSSGAIKFGLIKNRDEIHKEISDLLISRQGKPEATTTIKQEIQQSNADELKKYKDLLDAGIISQEEFNAKKAQLLGL
jgi:hypothetical protein